MHFTLLEKKKINYSKALYDVRYEIKTENSENLSLVLHSAFPGEIVYTLDGSTPNINSKKYTSPIPLEKSCVVKAGLFANAKVLGRILEKEIRVNKASGNKIIFTNKPSKYYNKTEGFGLVNGIVESESGQRENCTGWCNEHADFTIQFKKEIQVKKIKILFLKDEANFIYPPEEVRVSINGAEQEFTFKVNESVSNVPGELSFNFSAEKINSLRLNISNPLKGKDSWILIDEIVLE